MKEHIEVLEAALAAPAMNSERPAAVATSAALRIAIDLMNAAKPLDEAEEKRTCEILARAVIEAADNDEWQVLAESRAQARAEGRTSNPNWGNLRRLNEEWEGVERDLKAQLSAAQAEIATLVANLADADNTRRALETKLMAAQAEIERLKQSTPKDASVDAGTEALRLEFEKQWNWCDEDWDFRALSAAACGPLYAEARQVAAGYVALESRKDELETKLTNLRTAAERQRDYRCTYAEFCEAIEASR